MIDLHAHLFPGVDDGPESLEESQAMLRLAGGDGIQTIVATPHVQSLVCRYRGIEELQLHRDRFIQESKGVEGAPQLLFGAEIHLTSELPELLGRHRDLLTINRSCYLLIEFPVEYLFPNSRDLLYELMLGGLTPVIAHPERNEVIMRNPKVLFPFVEMGILCQVDAGSITGDFGEEVQRAALYLLAANAAHLVASDAHDAKERPPLLSPSRKVLEHLGPERLDLLFRRVPEAIVSNDSIPDLGSLHEPASGSGWLKKIRGWFS